MTDFIPLHILRNSPAFPGVSRVGYIHRQDIPVRSALLLEAGMPVELPPVMWLALIAKAKFSMKSSIKEGAPSCECSLTFCTADKAPVYDVLWVIVDVNGSCLVLSPSPDNQGGLSITFSTSEPGDEKVAAAYEFVTHQFPVAIHPL